MDLSGPGFTVHGWWLGAIVGTVVLVVAAGNWRRVWFLPVLPRLRGVDPSFIAAGQAGIGVAALVFSAAELVPIQGGWHLGLMVAGFFCFTVGGLGSWAYGSYFVVDHSAVDPDRER